MFAAHYLFKEIMDIFFKYNYFASLFYSYFLIVVTIN